MLFILNKSYEVVGTLNHNGDLSKITTYFDDEYVQDLGTGAETFQFSTLADNSESQHLVAGNFIAFREEGEFKLFNIIQIEECHEETFIKTVYCEMAGIELINEIIRPMKVLNSNLRKFLNTILEQTDWKLGKIDAGFTQIYDFEIEDYTSVYSLIQEYAIGTYGAEISYRVEIEHGKVIGKYIDCYAERGKSEGFRFAYGSNLTSVTRTVDSTELATALIGVGNNGITFKEVNVPDKPKNQDFIVNESAYKRWNVNGSHIVGVHKADTDSPQELLRLTRLALAERGEPKVKYEMSVETLGEKINIGDTVNIVDHEFNPPLYLSARVNQITKSKTNPYNDEVVLANFKEVNSNITNEMRQLASKLEGYVDNKFPISGDKIQDGAVSGDKISQDYTDKVVSDSVNASKLVTNELIADKANISDLKAINATINNLKANKAEIGDLNATNATIGNLKVDVAKINTLLAGNITADNIQAGTITADKIAAGTITAGSGIIADGAIGSAQISKLDAGKISSGTVDTSKVTVAGANSHLRIKGNRLQVFQGLGNQAKERVSLGDVNGDGTVYGLRVRGADGQTVLMDENGVKSEGITDGSITNDKISDNANIDGEKININSVIDKINDDGSKSIIGTKIQISQGSLETVLSEIKETQDEQSETISQAKSEIQANTNSIKLKVSEQSYREDKEKLEKSLSKTNSEISVLKNQIELKAEHTDIQNAIDNMKIGTSNYINNSGEFENTDSWSGNCTISNKELVFKGSRGEGLINDTEIKIEPNETYVFSATLKLPNNFEMTEKNLLKYITIGG